MSYGSFNKQRQIRTEITASKGTYKNQKFSSGTFLLERNINKKTKQNGYYQIPEETKTKS